MTQPDVSHTATTNEPQASRMARRWRRLDWFSRALLVLLFGAVVVFAAASLFLHQVLVPRVAQYREQLEQRATRALGVPVRIGAVLVHSEGSIPSFELQQVQLLDAQGRAALTLPKVMAAVSVRSLLSLGFEQIHIDSPQLDVRRDANGHFVVAGLTFGDGVQSDTGAANWFFSQAEFVIRHGSVQWTDDMRQAPSIALQDVDVVVRNPGRHHRIRIDATPPDLWGDRFTLQGEFTHRLWESETGNWRRWSGQAFAQFGRVDVSELKRYTHLGVQVQQGRGALRAWVDLKYGEVSRATADVALQDVHVALSPKLPALELDSLSGRLGGSQSADGFEFFTQELQFTTHAGLKWPGGNVYAKQNNGRLLQGANGQLRADKLDLVALAQIANWLPLDEVPHRWLTELSPKGMVETVQAQWVGEWDRPKDWSVKGKLSGIEVAAQAQGAGAVVFAPGRPGLKGAQLDFDVREQGGQAQLLVKQGALSFPGVFEDPRVLMDDMSASFKWSKTGDWSEPQLEVSVDKLRFANADMQGAGTVHWRTRSQAKGDARFPGMLDMDVTLTRAEGTRVHRYLPLGIPKPTREYVQAAVSKGRSDEVKMRVKGDLNDFPFSKGNGEFRIQAQVMDATYAYVPVKNATGGNWPALSGLNGQLIFDRASMEVKAASSGVAGTKQLQTAKVQAQIADLDQPVVKVQGDVRGPLSEMLDVVKLSPLNGLIQGALAQASGSGDALTQLQLELPLSKLEASKVTGSLSLAGNDLRITPDTPGMSRTKGVVQFSETGFQLSGVQARFLGGDMKLEGGSTKRAAGLVPSANEPSVVLKAQGVASAQGLREAKELGLVAQLAKSATGSASYAATLGFRRSQPELVVTSNLVGLALNLPQPMVKSGDTPMPLRYEQLLRKDSLQAGQVLQDVISLDVGTLVNIDFVRDVSGAAPKVLRGTIGVGLPPGPDLPMPAEGVAASIVFDHVDLDAWDRVFQSPPSPGAAPANNAQAPAYWPNAMALRAKVLMLGGRQFNRVVVGGTREGMNWRANMDAEELDGYLEFRQAQGNAPAALYARLTRLNLGASTASEIESALDQQAVSVPSLDVVVEDLEYKSRKLGRVQVDAAYLGRGAAREWRLRKLSMNLPEASLQASGNWTRVGELAAAPAAQAAQGARPRPVPRRTALKFKLDVQDSGALLQRFGMGELVRKTPGSMEGQISWVGSPFALDYASLQGQFAVDMKEGQFLKVEPGVARLLGVLSLQSLPRRLALDFRDVFSEGFAFDSIRGDVAIESGIAKTNNLQMKGVVAGVLMEGTANIAKETQDLHVVVVPEINAGTASLFAAAVNPIVGLGTFLAQAVIRRPLIKSNTEEFRVEGSWSDPKVTKLTNKDIPVPAPAASQESAQ